MASAASSTHLTSSRTLALRTLLSNSSFIRSPVPRARHFHSTLPDTRYRKMAAELVVPIAEVTVSLLKNIVDGIGGVDRKIAIGFKNNTDYTLENVGVYFESGSSNQNIAHQIPSQSAGLFSARKSQNTARGSVGVFSYYIQGADKTVHVMWSVPYDYNLYSNWWNAVVVDGRQDPNNSVYDRLYNGSGGFPYPHKPDQWTNDSSNGFQLLGNMTNNGQATLEVEFRRA